MKKRSQIPVVLGLSALTAIVLFAHFRGRQIPNELAARSFPIHGVDVSHHQGAIDWPSVASDHIGFAYIKATEGGDFRDDFFKRNWTKAAANRIPRGAYHFFSFKVSGARQSDNFIATVPVDPSALPPAVDLEYGENVAAYPSVSKFQKELTALLSCLRRAYHKEPVVYTTEDFYVRYLANYPVRRLWIRNTLARPRLPPARSWLFWQFADTGRVKGIRTPVDLNVFAGDRAAFHALTTEDKPVL